MQDIISSEKALIKLWLNDMEEGAIKQAMNLANLPFIYKHVAIMPDAHQGYGMPIGGVLATSDVVIPNAVGVDIGCGVIAVQTNIHETCCTESVLRQIMCGVRELIPLGFNKHKKVPEACEQWFKSKDRITDPVIRKEYDNACISLGTLGGGNHFIEFQLDDAGLLWIMIHSGSRNLGYKVAEYYNQVAIQFNTEHAMGVPSEWELAGLPVSTEPGQMYLNAMRQCIEFAKANRALMMCNIKRVIEKVLNVQIIQHESWDVAHNYVRTEEHFGKRVWIHRKGATAAGKGIIGIIPGSQGTCSYIVEGKGNKDSFRSCSHGAGRKMSRTKAKKVLDLAKEQAKLNDKGIIHTIYTKKDLDEATGAYKDIEVVMANQKDLVEIVNKLRPIAVIKG